MTDNPLAEALDAYVRCRATDGCNGRIFIKSNRCEHCGRLDNIWNRLRRSKQ